MARATAIATVLPALVLALLMGMAVALAGFIQEQEIAGVVEHSGSPLSLSPGRVAGRPDIRGNITVEVNNGSLSAVIIVHPTYQVTVYPGLLNLTNKGNITYNYSIIVLSPFTGPPGSVARLYDYNASNGTLVYRANLSSPGVYGPYQISPGETVELSLLIYYPEGAPLEAVNASIRIAYSPTNETPPPSLGG